MRATSFVVGAALVAVGASTVTAQDVRVTPMRTLVRALDNGDQDRAALGISTGSTGKRDTLGLLIESITPNGPADKAGLEEGYRIAAVNGQNLKLAPADAGQPDMNGLMTRRLTRELGKLKAGDDVTLDLYADGAHKTVKVKTVALEDLAQRRVSWTREDIDNRAVLGLGLGGGGSRRDTLGLLITSVANDGPADKAGIEEGNRIARIDSVDLRIPADEAVEGGLVGAKESRFMRVLSHMKAGDAVTLQVWANGAMKTVKVTLGREADVYPNRNGVFRLNINGDNAWGVAPTPPMPPMPPMPAVQPRVRVLDNGNVDIDMDNLQARVRDLDRMSMDRVKMSDAVALESREVARQSRLAAQQAKAAIARARARGSDQDGSFGDRRIAMDDGVGAMWLGGIHLAPVSDGLASYFGKGSERGVLVLETNDDWKPLAAGDVILSINGEPVRDGGSTRVSLDSDRDNTLVVLRKGVRTTLHVKAH